MTDNIIPLRFNCEEVGKHVKASKKRFTWEVSLNSKQHVIVLDFSFISGKVKVTVDRRILLQNQLPTNTSFQYPFTLDGNALNVIQQGDNFELRINNKVFSHLYNQMKTNKEFKKYQDEIKDISVNENQFQAKKMTLNIGGVGTGMKKKPKTESYEQHSWNAFGQEDSSFPSYFDGNSTSASSKQNIQQKQQKRNLSSLLDVDEPSTVQQSKQQKSENILDFEVEVPQNQYSTNSRPSNDYNTMQQMFSTLNMNNPTKTVVINSSEVDFFAETTQVPSVKQVSSPNVNEYSTLQQMFSTTTPQSSFTYNQTPPQNNFATNFMTNSNKQDNSGLNGFTLDSNPIQPVQTVQSPVLDQNFNMNDFSTMQKLFATNTIQPTLSGSGSFGTGLNVVNPPSQVINPQQFGTNSLQNQFATTQINSSNQFGTNIKPNQFATGQINLQSNSQQFGTGQLNLQSQPQPQPQLQQFGTQNNLQSTQPPVDVSKVNLQDFNSMQKLFQTNNFNNPNQPPQSFVKTEQTSVFINTTPVNNNFNSGVNLGTNNVSPVNFNTGSPNMMFMNTYSGNINGLDPVNSNQFNTSFNVSMKKTTTQTTVVNSASKPNDDLI